MKIRSLLLGSLAAAGLSTGAFAADPAGLGVLTSLDVCDALGLSGLTISSDTNCLQITGEVKYEFKFGDYAGDYPIVDTPFGTFNIISPDYNTIPAVPGTDAVAGTYTVPPSAVLNSYSAGDTLPDGAVIITAAVAATPGAPAIAETDVNLDWYSKVEAYIKFVASSDTDFGKAQAVIKIKDLNEYVAKNSNATVGGDDTGNGFGSQPIFDEAYVSIGDSTIIMAGKKSSIKIDGDDEPFNWLGLFNSSKVDAGVGFNRDNVEIKTGGHVIQVVSDLGNGISAGIGLENINDSNTTRAGTAVGYLSYAGEGITAHVTGFAGGVLDGDVEEYAVHAGFTGSFDMFRIRAAAAFSHDVPTEVSYYNALASAEATLDIFKIAISGEVVGSSDDSAKSGYGVGASAGVTVTDGVAINIGGRYFNNTTGGSDIGGYQAAIQLVASVTETLTLTGEAGIYGRSMDDGVVLDDNVFYGSAELAWAPGGGFTSSIKGEANSLAAYRLTFKAAKSFE
ncbi:MAG: outer membrane protein [Devosia sp.]|nr:outer membrane protein [Devosia sp.]